jgi:hypothetical protein
MRITVRQLKGLIREAVEDAMVGGDGVAPRGVSPREVSPRVQAKIESVAKKYRKYFYTEDPVSVLHDVADDVSRLPGAKSLEGLFAHVDMVVNALKGTMDDQTFQEVKASVAEFKEEKKQYHDEDKAEIG